MIDKQPYGLHVRLQVFVIVLEQPNHDDVIKSETFSALLAICAGNSPVPR